MESLSLLNCEFLTICFFRLSYKKNGTSKKSLFVDYNCSVHFSIKITIYTWEISGLKLIPG